MVLGNILGNYYSHSLHTQHDLLSRPSVGTLDRRQTVSQTEQRQHHQEGPDAPAEAAAEDLFKGSSDRNFVTQSDGDDDI